MKNKLLLIIFLSLSGLKIVAQIGGYGDPVKLSSNVNTNAEEGMPLITLDKSTFYFTRTNDSTSNYGYYDQNIWFSTIENGEFIQPELVKSLNNKFNNAILGISKDGETIYLLDSYQGKKDKIKGVSYSKKTPEGWAKPIHLEVPTILNDGNFFGFHIDDDENVIIFSLKGPETIGEEDLYVSRKTDNIWSIPTHMGNVINSKGYEMSPFISKSLDTLFFSSNGFGGVGDVDILFSIRQDDTWTSWSEPTNLGPKVNSPKYDAFFSIIGNQGYYSSNRDSELGDIYSVEILPPPPFDGSMFKNLSTVQGEIDLSLEGPEAPYTIKWATGETTEDLHNLEPGFYTATITDKYGRTVEVTFEIKTPPAPEKKKVNSEFTAEQFAALFKDINTIYFDIAKYDIRKDAAKELDKIVKIMNDNPTLEIELGSHTDCQSSDELNLVLSHNRAKKSAEYIKEKITKPERINGKGYGESQPKVSCNCDATDSKSKCSKKENQMNRRTEFTMKNENSSLTEDIASLPYQTFDSKNKSTTTKTEVVKPEEVKTDSSKSPTTKTETKNSEALKGETKFRTDIVVTSEQEENIKNGFYILSEGETLYRASINSKIPIADIRRINKLKSNSVKPGTKLLLR